MLEAMFPRAHACYSLLPVLGKVLDGLCVWLQARGYPRDAIRRRMAAASSLSRALHRRKVRSLGELTGAELRSFAPPPKRSCSPPLGALVRSLTDYLEEQGDLSPTTPSPTGGLLGEYGRYLSRVRGLSATTTDMHTGTAAAFLRFLDHDARPERLQNLRGADVEAFIAKIGERVGRARMGSVTAVLRTFLRFLATTGAVSAELVAAVDSPRSYRGERLPRALLWEAVLTFLRSIDRSTAKGRRDFAMFLLIATYGLRASEVRALRLEDVAWRARRIRVLRPKVGTPILLPLTDDVGAVLLDYLRSGRPVITGSRQMFLRVEFPLGPLGRGAVGDAFRTWARRAGISVPVRGGPHCLRHALAMHLLRQGAAPKTIGDLLGHRCAESTGVYLRLDVNDLRGVALPLPAVEAAEGVRS